MWKIIIFVTATLNGQVQSAEDHILEPPHKTFEQCQADWMSDEFAVHLKQSKHIAHQAGIELKFANLRCEQVDG